MSPSSYGHTYLTSYGWTGSGTGLRKGAIDKPLAIPPKKNISGLGKDRDEAFPFWDHLFTVASKAITIKLSGDDEDTDDDDEESKVPREGDPETDANPSSSDLLRRTTTGILSNLRPASGTPATTSGSTTPDPARPPSSLLATARREAARRGLYSRFFRGPVLGPDDDGPSVASSPSPTPSSSPSFDKESFGSRFTSTSASVSAFTREVAERVSDRDEVGEAKKSKKRKSKDDGEDTREQRRERKRLKKECKAARAAKRAEKALKEKEKEKDLPDGEDRKDRKRQDEGIGSKGNESKKARKRKSLPRSEDHLGPEKCTQNILAPTSGQQETSHGPHSSDVIPTSKKKRKRKNTLS